MKCERCGRTDRILILREYMLKGVLYKHCVCKACGKEFTVRKTRYET
jgi:translation initiation factor 2 beta subunit (eIF-2beta)/eIF-5